MSEKHLEGRGHALMSFPLPTGRGAAEHQSSASATSCAWTGLGIPALSPGLGSGQAPLPERPPCSTHLGRMLGTEEWACWRWTALQALIGVIGMGGRDLASVFPLDPSHACLVLPARTSSSWVRGHLALDSGSGNSGWAGWGSWGGFWWPRPQVSLHPEEARRSVVGMRT